MWKDLKNSNKSTTYGLDSTIWPLKFGALDRARLSNAAELNVRQRQCKPFNHCDALP